MSVINRRNAVIGWATWSVAKQLMKRKSKVEAEAAQEKVRSRRWRRPEPEPEPEPKKKRGRKVIGLLAATAIGTGIWLSTRGRRGAGPVE